MLTATRHKKIQNKTLCEVKQSILDTYKQEGAVLLKAQFDESWITALRESADRSLSQSENYFLRQRVWEQDEACRDFCLHSAAPALAATFLESSTVNLLYDQVFAKTAGDPATPWHNDLPYWPVRNGKALTVWLALDPIKFNAGPLEIIAGSHLWDKWFQPFTTAQDGSAKQFYEGTETGYDPLPDFETERNRHRLLCWEMEPGDVIIFDGMSVHGAKANTSTGVRRGYAVRYTGEGMTYHSDTEINRIIVNPSLQDGQKLDSAQYPAIYFDS